MSKHTCIFSNTITEHVAASFKCLLLSRYGNASVASGEVGYKEKAQPQLPTSSRSCSVQMFSGSAVRELAKCSGRCAGSGWGGAARVFGRNPTLSEGRTHVQYSHTAKILYFKWDYNELNSKSLIKFTLFIQNSPSWDGAIWPRLASHCNPYASASQIIGRHHHAWLKGTYLINSTKIRNTQNLGGYFAT